MFLLTQDLESPSGLGRYLPLAKELVRLGHGVDIAALHPSMASLDKFHLKEDGVNVWYVAPMHVWKQGSTKGYYPWNRLLAVSAKATKELSARALSTEADIIHVCKPHPMNSLAAVAAKQLRRTRLFLDCDDYEAASGHFASAWQRKVVSLFERWMPRRAEMVTTNTFFMRNKLIGWGVPSRKVVYLPNGVDQRRFADPEYERVQALRDELGLSGAKIVIYVGSLSRPSHRVDLLLESFPLVRRVEPKCTLLLVGGGDDYEALKKQAVETGMGEAIRFCGHVPPADVPLYYHMADVSVEPVHDDDAARGRSPLKMFESWSCGVPFVTADVGDRRQLLGTPEAGMLVAPGSREALAEGILRVLTDSEFAQAIRYRGLERVQAFTWDRLARQLEAAYQGLN